MKRFLALAALVLGMVSCQTEPEGLDVIVGGEQDVTINVTIPETETRATAGSNSAVSAFSDLIATDTYVARYIFEVYYEGNMIERQVKYVDAESTSFRVRLIPERDYQFVVWTDIVVAAGAQDGIVSNNLHYVIGDTLQNITLNNDTWVAMDESRDAFTATYPALNFNGAQSINIELVRPLAKLRVVTTDCDDIKSLYNLTATRATVEYTTEHRTAFNAFTGKAAAADGTKTHTYEIATYGNENDTRRTIFTDYFFAENDVVNFIFTVYDNNDEKIKMTNFNTPINVRRNYLTTLEGNVLTDGNDIGITVNPGFGNNGENVENYTVITSASDLLAVMNTDGEYVVGNNIVITANAAATSAATRTGAAPKTTIINLNGYTITVENKTDEALATIEQGNKLVFEGEGVIELTNDSTAPFIENTDGVVIIEEATLTNNSTNQEATIVNGNAIVNDGANVDNNAISGETTSQLEYVLANGGEVTLLQDIEETDVLFINTTNPIVINGNNKTITSSASRVFRIIAKANVTINNLNIVSTTAKGSYDSVRGISMDGEIDDIVLTLNNCSVDFTADTAHDWSYAINKVGETSKNVQITINGGTYEGANVVNIWGNENIITINGATLNSLYRANEYYCGCCIRLEGSGNIVNIDNATFTGDHAVVVNEKTPGANTVNYGENNNTENLKRYCFKAGSELYYTLEDAVAATTEGEIKVLASAEMTEKVTIAAGKNITLNLNGRTISGKTFGNTNPQDLFLVKGNLTVKNGTITAEHVGENMGWNGQGTIFNITAGGVLNLNTVNAKYLGGTDMGFVAHLNNWGEVTLNVENSTLEANYVAVRVFNSGNDMNNVTIKNSTLKGGNYAFWVHNYTVADFGTEAKAEAHKALLNFDIFDGTNTFLGKNDTPIRYGFTNAIYTAPGAAIVSSAEELANIVNNATSDITVMFGADLTGKISLTQKPGIDVTIDGNGKKYTGGIHIFGNGGGHSKDRSMTIKNINFDGTGLTGSEGCIYTGNITNGINSYACLVTIEDCTFTGAGVAAIRENKGGSVNWTIKRCTVDSTMHSFLQFKNNEGEGLLIEDCTVYSKNGANLNSTCKATFNNCVFNVKGYAVRVGADNGNPDATKVFNFNGCELTSANDDGDAVVIIRGDAVKATLNFVGTVLDGDPKISGNTTETTINGLQ